MGDTRRGRHVGCVSELQPACSVAGLSQPCCACTHTQQQRVWRAGPLQQQRINHTPCYDA